MGSFSCSVLALLFPPLIDLLLCYSNNELTGRVIAINSFLIGVFVLGFSTGTYSALNDILKTFQS
jgi:ABC-type arginine transport system permease subunit